MNRRVLVILLFLTTISQSIVTGQKGYSIDIAIKGASKVRIRLAYHLGNDQYIRDSTVTDISGRCRFSGDEPLPAGVYMIVFPGKTYTEFLVDKNQHFGIACNMNDPAGSLKFSKSDENTRFIDYQRKWKTLQEEAIGLSSRLKEASPESAEAKQLRSQISDQERKMKQYLHDVSETNRGSLLGAIAQSLIPVELTAPDVPQGVAKRDSLVRLYSYLNYKAHFFDNTDLTQPGLIRSPVLASKLDQFYNQVVIQIPDSVIKETKELLKKSERNKDVFQYVAMWVFNKYAASEIMGHDAIVVYLADNVYLKGKAPWASETFLTDLAKRVEKIRPNLIGNKAPELVMDSFQGRFVSLYDLRADYTILYFWEPDCGHCKEATPLLKKFYDENKKYGVEVFAVCTQHDRDKWEKYILEHDLNWINGWDPKRMTRFDLLYNVDSTPIIYILDKNKKIIAKRLPVEKLGSFIDSYRKYSSQSVVSSGR